MTSDDLHDPLPGSPRRVIKRYSNRKLYDTRGSTYVTLLQIAEMIRAGEDVQVIDNATKEDKTDVTLALIISEELRTRPRAVPLSTLKALIRHGGERILSQLRGGPMGKLIPGEEASATAGRALRRRKSQSSWAWRSGSHPISVMAPSVATSTPPSMRYVAPSRLHPADAEIVPSAKPIRMRVSATSGRATLPSVTAVERNSRPSTAGVPPTGSRSHPATSSTAGRAIREMVIPVWFPSCARPADL